MRNLLIIGAVAAIAGTAPAFAQEAAPASSITGNIALASDYTFRGISQTNGNPAVQGGFDFTAGNFYAGTWASNIDFGFPGQSIELDLYAGFKFNAGPVAMDVGVIDYVYPGIKDCGVSCGTGEVDYYEGYVKGSYSPIKPLTIGGALYYSPEYTGKTGQEYYIEANGAYAFSDQFAVSGAVGYDSIDDVTGVFAGKASDDYLTWNLGGTFTMNGIALDLRYVDTNIKSTDAIVTSAFTTADKAKDRIILSIKKAL